MNEYSAVYVRVPLHVKKILLKFLCSPYSFTGRGFGIKDRLLIVPNQTVCDTKYHYITILVQGTQSEKTLAHLTDVLAEHANLLLTSWVLAKIDAGHSGMEAVSSFLKYCEIDDDTYSIESCYRQWMRIKNKLMS